MDNQAKHTPGPWIADSPIVHLSPGHDVAYVVKGSAIIAQIWLQPDGGQNRLNELVANARLMAAAPEMLEALKEAVDLLENYLMESDREASPNGRWPKLRAAIAKAEGRE